MNQYTFKQNDLPARLNSANGKNEHCFAVTLYVCACDAINRLTNSLAMPNVKTYIELYKKGNLEGVLKDETGTLLHGAYVVSDRRFFQLVLDWYGYDLKVHRTDKDADYLILNIKTANGGHFRELNYDPWYKEVVGKYVKSVRGFKVVSA